MSRKHSAGADYHDRVGTGRLAKRSVIVMGAGNGIGLRYAEAFAAEGASVTIADIDGAAAAAAARRRVDDLVEFVLLLCSDSAAFLTGQTVTVDGGFVKRI